MSKGMKKKACPSLKGICQEEFYFIYTKTRFGVLFCVSVDQMHPTAEQQNFLINLVTTGNE